MLCPQTKGNNLAKAHSSSGVGEEGRPDGVVFLVIRVTRVSEILLILEAHEDKNVPVRWWGFNRVAHS